ncbi:MAG: TolC family protein, partial [Acidobacteriota bacterium]
EAEHVVELYRSRLLPASGDHVRAALAGFETGQNSFLALIEAERNQRTIQLNYQAALADFHRRRAELDRALGRIPGSASDQEAFQEIQNDPRAKALHGGLK